MAITNKTETCTWIGASQKHYQYHVHPLGASFKKEAGNYVFAKRSNSGRWVAIYIGETSDLSERFDNHHAMHCISRQGATHIHAHLTSGGKQVRLDEETDLRNNYNPPCNKQ